MYHNIKVNVVGPMKSGKSKIVTEQNDSSADTSRENAALAPHKEPASGELAAAPCSAFSAQKELRKNAAKQSAALRKQADSIDKRMLDLPTDLPDYLYKHILWN